MMRTGLSLVLVALACDAAPPRVFQRNCDFSARRSDRGGVACSYTPDAGNSILSGFPIASAYQCDAGTTVYTGSPVTAVTIARASSAYCSKDDGTVVLIGSNLPRLEKKGLLVEGASSNSVTAPRDGTDVSWVKTNVTAARVTGADGVASSGTSFTATGANGTALTTVTIAAATRSTSMRMKRRTGTGAISVTRNNGTNYLDIGPSLSSTTWKWVRKACGTAGDDVDYRVIDNCIEWPNGTASVLNPVIGVKIGTSGDAVDVDFVQDEAGGVATSPMSGFARAADLYDGTNSGLPTSNGQLSVDFSPAYDSNPTNGVTGSLVVTAPTALNNCGARLDYDGTTGTYYADLINSGGSRTSKTSTSSFPEWAGNARNVRLAYGTNTDAGVVMNVWVDGYRIINSGSFLPDCHTNYDIGNYPNGTQQLQGWLSRIQWTSGIPQDFAGSTRTIRLTGDSITEATGTTAGARPQSLISTFTGGRAAGIYVSNGGTSGYTIDQCKTSWDSILAIIAAEGNPALKPLSLLCGSNSSADGAASVFGKLQTMMESARDAGVPAMISTMTPYVAISAFNADLNTMIRNTGADAGWCVADVFPALVDVDQVSLKSAYDFGDARHLNTAGTAAMVAVQNTAARNCGLW